MADLFGNNLANNLTEGVAADNILGAGGNDTLNGGGGNDSIYGDSVNDSLNSGAGQDFVYGGEGNDALNALEAGIDNGIGDDVYIGEGKDTLNTLEAGIDNGIGDDVYIEEGNDDLSALEPDIDNAIGDDVYIGEGKDTLNTLEGGIDNAIGDDVHILANLFGNNLPNNLTGGGAADNIFGAGGNDTLNGGAGDDNIYGDSGNDSLNSGAGLDFMYGGEGNDTLNALAAGADNLFGGIGDDVYIVNWTQDNLVEGPNQGIDIVHSSSFLTYTLDANVENLLLTGASNIDGTGNNLNNQIRGNSGNNTLSGSDGNDTLSGGGGNDTLTGGLGSNQFLFNTAVAPANVDRITDFSIPLNDRIILDKSVFSALETPVNSALLATDFAVINVAAAAEVVAAGNSVDEIVYNRRTGNLFYNPNNNAAGFGAGGGRFATITFVGSNNLSNTHFRVVA
jgi:Ca2+-binding RTX toxin-like protein